MSGTNGFFCTTSMQVWISNIVDLTCTVALLINQIHYAQIIDANEIV
jgi:hypothetical protein